MEYSRVPSECIYVHDYTKESAAEKGEGGEGGDAGRKRWGTEGGGRRLVGEEDDGGSRRDHAALSSINLSAAVV